MDHQTDQEAAVAAVTQIEVEASIARAIAVFDALDAHAEHLTSHDRYDFALGNWRALTAVDADIPEEKIAALALRAYGHLPEQALVDVIDIEFGEKDRDIALADGGRLVWLPQDEALILSIPVEGGVVDAVLCRRA